MRELGGPASVLRTFSTSKESIPRELGKGLEELAEQVKLATRRMALHQERRFEADSRTALRELSGEAHGLIERLRVIHAQQDYLKPDPAGASLDSELALLWWNFYPRASWQGNGLSIQARGAQLVGNQTMMVMRLDAPQAGQVRDIVLASLKAERDGLKGKVVLDSRSIPAKGEDGKFGSYGWYDQSIRDLAQLITTKTKLRLLHDVSAEVLPANATGDVALYCGWYSVRNYVPTSRFNPGAVGFHVASFELVSLRAVDEKGWVAGMLNDGIAGTMGAVAEPYLAAFPPADEFVGLLMTGKLTLAEVYWKTAPVTSWMLTMIGDPLYRPYAKDPPLKLEDLPEKLRKGI
jgi:uncharacterized protein (TIGR03790 family)